MCDTNLEWTVFLDSFCLLQNYWTWKWCNDDNKMSFFSTNHIYLSLFYWNVFIFVLTLFLGVDWIVTLLECMVEMVDQALLQWTICSHLFFPFILFFDFPSPHPSIFHFPFILFILNFVWYLPTVFFHTSFSSIIIPFHFLLFFFPLALHSSFSISYLIFVCNSLLNFALITSIKSLMWAFHRKHRSSRKEFLTIYRLHTIIFTYAHWD